LFFGLAAATLHAAPDTVVICPAEFREALRPWVEFRTAEGHTIVILSNLGSIGQLRRQIGEIAQTGRLRFVVLVGDAPPIGGGGAAAETRCVPLHYAKARVNIDWGSEPEIATDHVYADLGETSDTQPRPELAVGRLTAASPQQLRGIVAKILAYERSRDFGPWRRQLNVVAGVGGLGPMLDPLIESTTHCLLTQCIPAAYHVSMTYASWRSPYCPDPRRFHAATIERLSEGAWFWVYVGHGYPLGGDFIEAPGGPYPILSASDAAGLRARHGPPIALFLSCYAGAIDARRTCLAAEMLRGSGGPVAVVAASRVTMPYATTLLALGLMRQCLGDQCQTLGEALLHAKQAMLKKPPPEDRLRTSLDALAAAFSPAPQQLAAERAEHVLLFNLLGDPLLRLHRPRQLTLKVAATATAGGLLSVAGSSPIDGRGTVELVVPRDRLTFQPPVRDACPQSPEELAEFQETYRRANDHRLASVEATVREGRFSAELEVPAAAAGRCHVCVAVEGAEDFALGSAEVKIVPRPKEMAMPVDQVSARPRPLQPSP
jgi:hypothetical protein